MPVASSDMGANLYAGSASAQGDQQATGGNLFIWITLTMLWVLMILAILALVKYVTGDSGKGGRKPAK